MNLRCLGCSSTAQKPLLVLTPSAQGSGWAGNGTNLRISWTLRNNLLLVGTLWAHPEFNPNFFGCWSSVLCQKSPVQVSSFARALWKPLCQSWGMLAFPHSPHHSNNQNYGSLGGEGNIKSNKNSKHKKKSLKLKLSVQMFLFAFLGSEYLDSYPCPRRETVAAWVAELLLGLESWFVTQCLALLALSLSWRINLWRHRCAHTGLNSVLLLQALPCK